MDQGANKMTVRKKGNQNIMHEEIPMVAEGDNFPGGIGSSSLGQASSRNDENAPFVVDLSPDTFDQDKLPEFPFENNGNNGDENEDAESESEEADEQNDKSKPKKRKHYQRHTQFQIQAMESFFKQCAHPDEKQRRKLGRDLGLNPLQVKFWFQNKRTQVKAGHQRKKNIQLRDEKEQLKCENVKLKETYSLTTCVKCGNRCAAGNSDDQDDLRLENTRIFEQIEHVKGMVKEKVGNVSKSAASSSIPPSALNQGSLQHGGELDIKIPSGGIVTGSQSVRPPENLSPLDKSLIVELANSAVDEVATLARIGEPVWIPDIKSDCIVLNEQEYFKTFQKGVAPRLVGFTSEASRECAVVILNPFKILEIFMELSKWLAVFSGITSKAMLIEPLSNGGEGIYNGAMQVISAEFQVLSPAVPSRDCFFVRYCKQLNEVTWAVVDVSVDAVLTTGQIARCQKRPSGCIIQAMPNGCSKIIWVEHVQVNDRIIHKISRPILSSGDAYSAKRWISILGRQCERLASAMGLAAYPYHGDLNGVQATPEARQSIVRLAERMVLSFCGGITASAYHWKITSGNGVDEVRIMTRKSIDDPGRPGGLVLCASICSWIPVLPRIVFDYLSHERTRLQWDVLCFGGGVKKIAHIGNGQEPWNCVTLLQVTNPQLNHGKMMMLQESSSEPTASFIIYAPVDVSSADKLFRGGNPENVPLLPSGFTIIPSGPPRCQEAIYDANLKGTLLSMSFQTLIDTDPYGKPAVASVAGLLNLIESTTDKIKKAFGIE